MEDNNESLIEQAGEVVTPQEDGAAAAQGAEGEQNPAPAERDRQSHEDNRRYAAARHAGEQAGYDRAMREVNEKIASTGMRNPATGDRIENVDGLEAYGKAFRRQQVEQRAKAENRSVEEVQEEEDNRDFLRQARKQQETERQTEKQKARQRDFILRDAMAFQEAYPDVDLGKLESNKAFMRFCGSRYGKEPLAELYGDYIEIAGEAAQAAVARAESKSARTTGAGGGSGAEALTASQQKALDEWNRTYPSMKMTAKEFLGR